MSLLHINSCQFGTDPFFQKTSPTRDVASAMDPYHVGFTRLARLWLRPDIECETVFALIHAPVAHPAPELNCHRGDSYIGIYIKVNTCISRKARTQA